MAKKRKPQPQQSGNDPSQMILGIVIGAVFSAVITSGIFLLSGSGGGSAASQTVALNAQSGQPDNSAAQAAVPIPSGGAGKAKSSSTQGASEDSSAMSAEMEMEMAANEGTASGNPAASAGESEMSEEMAMQMEMAANTGGASGKPATPSAGGTSPEMSAEMEMEMAMQMAANNGTAGASIPGANASAVSMSAEEMSNLSLDGSGEAGMSGPGASGGTTGGGLTGKPDPAFEAELAEIEVPEQDLKLPELIKFVQPSIVRIKTQGTNGTGAGTGFVVSESGLVMTSYHVIEGIDQATIEFSDGTKGNVTGYRFFDPLYDIAVIQIEVPGKKLKPLPIGDVLLNKGEEVVAFGASRSSNFSTTEGTISEIFDQKQMQVQVGVGMKGTWLQSSIPISSEISGGPLVNLRGQVVAMNTMQASIGKNLNYAVSSLDVLAFAKVGSGKEIDELDSKKLLPANQSLKRLAAKDIQGSNKGNELLAKIDQINVQLVYDQATLDPNALLKNGFFAYAKRNIEKMDIPVSTEDPKGDEAVLIVTIRSKASRKTDPDRQTILANAFLIVKSSENKSGNDFVKVWSVNDYEIATVSIRALSQGFIPKTFAPKVSSFFNKFKSAHSKANRTVKTKKG